MRNEYCCPVFCTLIPVFCSVIVGKTYIKLRSTNVSSRVQFLSVTGRREIYVLILKLTKISLRHISGISYTTINAYLFSSNINLLNLKEYLAKMNL